jgi:ankyrin repeat protein
VESTPPPIPLNTPERVAVAAAIEAAFLGGGTEDENFAALLDAVSAPEDVVDARARLVDVQHAATGATPLMVAAGKGRADVVDEMLARGARLEVRSPGIGLRLAQGSPRAYHSYT